MDYADQKMMCRTCLTEASKYKSLLSKLDGDERTLSEVLSNLTSVSISVNDKYPKQVCDACHKMILKADEFKKKCLQSDSILKNGFHSFDELIKHEIINTEEFKIAESDNKSQVINSTCFDSSIKNPTVFIETEVPIAENFYNSHDSLGDSNFVKEEHDDFLQDEINDIIIDTNLVEKLDLESTNSTLCGLAIDISNLKNHKKKNENISEKIYNKEIKLICTVCNEQFSNYEHLQAHILSHKKSKDNIQNYRCTICETNCTCEISFKKNIKGLKNKPRLKVEKRTKKNSKNILVDKKQGIVLTLICPKCTESFPNLQLFQLHLKTHIDDPTNSKIEANQQNSIKLVNEEKNYQCSMCMRTFARKFSLVAHIKRHEDRAQVKFTCKTCKREFQHRAHLENHVDLVHSKQEGFTCDVCSKSFSTQESLDSHNEGHKVFRKHECHICGKSFTMYSTLTAHLKIHTGEKPYLCSVCGRGFSQKTNLMQHMRRHQGLKPFKCDSCERRFVSKGELEAHNRKHSGAHPFVCDECGGSFTTSSSLTKHRRIHTGERPYACDLCPMRFTVLNTLKNHRRTHTGEKPYQCSYCEKAFTQRNDLVSHIRCHTGERPYICTICGQGFRKSSVLKVHIKVHGKEPQ